MARLSLLKPSIRSLGSIVKAAPKVADVVYRSAEWRRTVAKVKSDRGAWCCLCGSSHRIIADHIVEVRDGGAPYDSSNLQLLCHACHNRKTAEARAKRARAAT